MAILTQYVVTHKGVEKLVTTDKKAADQYDKILDIADGLAAFIDAKGISLEEDVAEALTVMLSKNRNAVSKLLKGTAVDTVLADETADIVELKKHANE